MPCTKVVLWDTRSGRRTPVQRSPLASSAHTHPIYCLDLVGSPNAHNLITVSTAGKMCSWNLDNFSQPQVREMTSLFTFIISFFLPLCYIPHICSTIYYRAVTLKLPSFICLSFHCYICFLSFMLILIFFPYHFLHLFSLRIV